MNSTESKDSRCEIKILELIGNLCLSTEDGERLYNLIHHQLINNQKVILDFEGVEICVSSFLNSSFGQLLKDIKKDDLYNLLQFKNIDDTELLLIKMVIENAVKYYSNKEHKQNLDQSINNSAIFS